MHWQGWRCRTGEGEHMGRVRSTKAITPEDALTVDLREELRRAKAGDKTAAREVLGFIHNRITSSHPLPGEFQQYLLDALRAGSEGRSVDAALGLRRRGRPTVPLQAKTLVAYVVQGFMRENITLDVAAELAEDAANQVIDKATQTPSAWEVFNGRHITSHQARKWYIEIIGADLPP